MGPTAGMLVTPAMLCFALCSSGSFRNVGASGVTPDEGQPAREFEVAHASDPFFGDFQTYVQAFGKKYTAGERETRFATFKSNLLFIRTYNAVNHSVRLRLNAHADVSTQDFAPVGLLPRTDDGAMEGDLKASLGASWFVDNPLPDEVDWVQRGALGPVQDQGGCGSCWAFAATSAISAAWQIATGQLVELSQQQLIDCSQSWGSHGCVSGNMESAYTYYAQVNVLCSADSYPYRGESETCLASCATALPRRAVVGYYAVPRGDERLLLQAVQGPVAVGIAVALVPAFQHYSTGVVGGERCGAQPNHAVVVVGYGTERGWGYSMPREYWLIRNSYGVTWGLEGYFKLARGLGPDGLGECAILSGPTYPAVQPGRRLSHDHRTRDILT